MVIQEPIFLAQRNRRWLKAWKILTIISSLASLMSSLGFMTSFLSSLITWSWSAVEISFLPSPPWSFPFLHVTNLDIFHQLMSPVFVGPGQISWPETYSRFLRWIGDILIFWRRGKAKSFPEEAAPLLQTRIPCFLSHVSKIPTPIGLFGPSWRNFLGGI